MRIREQQKEQVRQALLKAGLELIEKDGLVATTIEAITSRAGTAKGTFYNYFKTKHDLVYAAINERTNHWEDELADIFREHATTLNRLIEVFRRITAWIEKHPELHWIWLMEGLQQTRLPNRKRPRSPFTQVMATVFAAGQTSGEIRSNHTPEEFAHDLSGVFLAHAARAYALGNIEILYDTLPRALDIYIHGALASPPTRVSPSGNPKSHPDTP